MWKIEVRSSKLDKTDFFSDQSVGRWRMTEFDIGAHNGVGGRQIDISKTDDGNPGCLGITFEKCYCEIQFINEKSYLGYNYGYPCATMTDGGTFLLHSGACLGKLGSCGFDIIEYPGENHPSTLTCGKVPGGALFCDYLGCYRYHDDTETFETLPKLNQESFCILNQLVFCLKLDKN